MSTSRNKKPNGQTRRDFFGRVGLGSLLIGSSFTSGMGHPKEALRPNSDHYQSLSLRTHEWFGDIEERLDLPKEWDVKIHHMAGNDSRVLSHEEIRSRITSPINTKRLREIAAGKKTAVILFDDLTRATPAKEIAPLLIEELKAGGIRDENILFVCMLGSHGAANEPDVRAKLGDEIVDNYPWINHNVHENLTDLGKTSRGNHLKVNYYVMQADVKVSISGIKVHGGPGYSGGAKAILPGVASLDAIEYMHTTIPGIQGNRNPTVGAGKIYHNDCRLDMEESARLAGLDFTVQLLINGRREIIGVYAGDVVDAFRPAVHDANVRYETKLARDVDVVITNGYPRTMQEYGFEWANQSLRWGGTSIVIWQMPLAKYTLHYYNERRDYRGKSFWDLNKEKTDPVERAGQVIVFSQYIQRRDMLHYPEEKVKVVKKWEDVLALLQKAHGPSTSVAVYPYIGVQHPPLQLDGP